MLLAPAPKALRRPPTEIRRGSRWLPVTSWKDIRANGNERANLSACQGPSWVPLGDTANRGERRPHVAKHSLTWSPQARRSLSPRTFRRCFSELRLTVGIDALANQVERPLRRPDGFVELDRAGRDGRGPAAVCTDVRTRRRRCIAAERGSPCAVAEFDLAELHRRGQRRQKPAECRRGQQPPMPE